MKVRDVIRLLEQDGWYLSRTRGSHPTIQTFSEIRFSYCSGLRPSDDLAIKTLPEYFSNKLN
jgi:predicted RNA binding protein YcfA (HicA-like mRNA interferase family)